MAQPRRLAAHSLVGLAVVAVMPLGAILGALGGWFFTRAILRRGLLGRLLGRVLGVVLGACLGATVLALRRDQAAALPGMAWGVGVGAVVGPLLFLGVVKMVKTLPRRRYGEVVDLSDNPYDEETEADARFVRGQDPDNATTM